MGGKQPEWMRQAKEDLKALSETRQYLEALIARVERSIASESESDFLHTTQDWVGGGI